jgi:hypothetical protein
MDAAVQNLVDENEIRKLVVRMSVGMDQRNFAMFRSAWADEVDLDIPAMGGDSVPLSGKLDADAYARGVLEMLSQFAATQHCSVNHLIEVDGDSAACCCYTYATHYLEGGLSDPWNIVGARYDFTAERLPRGWRIVRLKWTRLFDQGNSGVWPEVARRLAAQSGN